MCGPSFVRNSSKHWPSYLSTGALCNGILHCHFAPFIFRQGYYCSHTPHIPLRLCVQGQGQVLTSFFTVQNRLFSPSSTYCAYRVMDHTGYGCSADSRSHRDPRRESGWCTAPAPDWTKVQWCRFERCDANTKI